MESNKETKEEREFRLYSKAWDKAVKATLDLKANTLGRKLDEEEIKVYKSRIEACLENLTLFC